MKILFFSISNSSFIERDFNILRSAHDVTKANTELSKLSKIIKLYKLIKNQDSIFCWFASLHYFTPCILARILKKKIYVVAGGYDVASVPQIKYGTCFRLHKRLIVRIILNLANKIFAVSNSNREEIILNCKIDQSKIAMIYHGFEDVPVINFGKKKNKILTIAVLNESSFKRKGIDKFISIAQSLPKIEFNLIGPYDEYIKNKSISKNVNIIGFVEQEKLNEILSSSKIYIQLSIHEGFGCSVAEAMQFGCVPVVSNQYSLPEVVGDCGRIFNLNESVSKIIQGIQSILDDYNSEMGLNCVERVKNLYSFENRRKLLLEHIV
jgi:glycosyltransferase involved in cell wall biosynthesis